MAVRADTPTALTRAVVDLGAVRENVSAFRRLVRRAQVMCVVKADAYGHGAAHVARAALAAGVDRFGVYGLDEALALRRDGITVPILVIGPFDPADADLIAAHDLTPTIHALDAARALAATGAPLSVHIKVDTGLTRAGLHPGEVPPLLDALRSYPTLALEGLYTHFARADEADTAPTARQLAAFLDVVGALADRPPLLHAANTAATLSSPETHLDMVRVGIGIYGYYPSTDVPRTVALRPALSLISRLTRVHRIPAGTGVGYGHEFVAGRETVVGLVPIGYGDGLPRTLGQGRGRLLACGRSAPIIGRVSMDQITVDLTDVPQVSVGDPVVLIGRQGDAVQTADDLAAQSGTISYDILTGLMPRIPRVYREPDE